MTHRLVFGPQIWHCSRFLLFAEIDHIKVFVLDEADEMLSRGFKDQIHEVFQHLPQDVQVILLSATMPPDVLEVSKQFMRDPVQILVKKDELTLEGKVPALRVERT